MAATLNSSFWGVAWQAAGGWSAERIGFLVSLPVMVVAFIWLAVELLCWGRTGKVVLAVLLVAAAATSYFTATFGVLIDRDMVANMAETNFAEAAELVTWKMAGWIAAGGLLPAWFVIRARVARPTLPRLMLLKVLAVGMAGGLLVASVAPFFQSYASLVRNHRDLRLRLVPTNLLAASNSYLKKRFEAPPQLQRVGLDTRPRTVPSAGKPRLLVLVVGETARAANFSLTGYGRETTPNLSAEKDVLAFGNMTACGTSTAVSLPCMFLDVGRSGMDSGLGNRRESLLDVLQRAGASVFWRDNNSGCKGVCDRVPREDVSQQPVDGLCSNGECWDERLLVGLQDRVEQAKGDTVVVLHMKGSHGPSYYLRYPPKFQHFTPACATAQLDLCSREDIINAYDNTLRYSDHVLSRTIQWLRSNTERFDPAMVYVSDHGESLGEAGLYLHGMPFALAPEEQKRVPLLVWVPHERVPAWGLEPACMRGVLSRAVSHDNLYHSVLGLMGVGTSIYRAELDVFAMCRTPSRL